ncbi:MAG: hypothetical protein QNK16_04355 [Woeseiaceae bacterium]|nr:hypothetical protein [Woeseiaceae bacterium]MDX2607593.1 hypothetical protein [Woeseiaceae bacterium]
MSSFKMSSFKSIAAALIGLALGLGGASSVYAQQAAEEANATEAPKSAEEIAKEMSNPASALASLSMNLQYTTYDGNLQGAGDQDSSSFIFQPSLPFPVGDKGRNILVRPAVPVLFNQPVFDAAAGTWDSAGVNLADIGFDVVYAGTTMQGKGRGYLSGIGMAGTLPTATDDDVGGDQWRFGPEVFGGIIRPWGIVGALASHQWDVGGSNNTKFSTTSIQYFYAYSIGNGMQIASSPLITYDWEADSDNAWTVPLGIGLSKTKIIGTTPWKFQGQIQYYAKQPDLFGPEWLLKFTATPVIKNPFVRE